MNTSKIDYFVSIGKADINWYSDCAKCFIDIFGNDRLPLVCKLFAATSINTSLRANITLFRKALYEIQNDLPIGDYLPNIKIQLQRIRDGRGLSGRKINNFASAMYGNPNAVVVDVWLMRAFDVGAERVTPSGKKYSRSPSKKQYDQIENYVLNMAKSIKIEPRQLSAMIWSGVRFDATGDRETEYKNILKRSMSNLFNCI